jgi:hypothetical protein
VTLGEKQRLFMRLLPRLIDKAHELGFELTGGDLYRDPRVHGEIGVRKGYGHAKSGHKNKLAIDLNLFVDTDGDGDLDYVETTERHRPLGEWWEQQHPLARWGGRFQDGNHYSIEHEGVK